MPDRYVMYTFIRGLPEDIREQLWGQRLTKTTDEAEKVAVRLTALKRKSAQIGKDGQHVKPSRMLPVEKRKVPKLDVKPRGIHDPKRQKAFDEFKLKKNNCFACGLSGHRRPECQASEDVKAQHQSNMAKLKATMYPTKQ
jgi:hypothetical protein